MKKNILFSVPAIFLMFSFWIQGNAYNWTNINHGNSGLWSNTTASLAYDQNNKLWVGYGVPGFGLHCFDGSSWTIYNHLNSGLPDWNDMVSSLFSDGNDLWIGTYHGLALLQNNQWTIYDTSNSGLKNNAIYFTKKDKQNNLWISHELGGFSIMINNIIYPFPDTSICPYFRYGMSDVVFDDTSAWISTTFGLTHFKLSDSTWIHYDVSNSNLLQNTVIRLARDHQGQIWLGYAGFGPSGIAKFDGVTFQNFNPYSSSYTWTSNLAVDSADNILIGSRSEGLYKFNGVSFEHISSPIPDTAASAFLFVDQYDRIWYDEPITGIWISDWTDGIYQIGDDQTHFEIYPTVAEKSINLIFESGLEDALLILLDSKGSEQYRIELSRQSFRKEVDINELSSGVYFITLLTKPGKVTRRFVKAGK